MIRSILTTALLAGTLICSAAVNATPILATAVLDSAQERAAGVVSDSPALGAAVLTVEPTTGEFDFSLEITGIDPSDLADLDAPPIISSIHLHNAPAGAEGPVVVDLGGGDPNANVTSFGNGGLSVNIDGGFFGGIVGNTLADANLNLARLLTEELYINVHTNDFPGGAIRGQLSVVQQSVGVPEPSTSAIALIALTVAGLATRHMRSRQV